MFSHLTIRDLDLDQKFKEFEPRFLMGTERPIHFNHTCEMQNPVQLLHMY